MKRTLKRLALLTMAMVLGFASCEKGDNGTINNGDSSITFDVSGTIARHDYVYLGLPSCTKWAT